MVESKCEKEGKKERKKELKGLLTLQQIGENWEIKKGKIIR
jgi:hypothetical protein